MKTCWRVQNIWRHIYLLIINISHTTHTSSVFLQSKGYGKYFYYINITAWKVSIWSFYGPYFPECGKIRTRKTLNTGTFLTVYVFLYLRFMSMSTCKIMKSLCHYEQPSVVHNKVKYRFYSTLSLTQAVVFAIFSQKMGVICYDYMLTTMGIYLIRKISVDMPPDRHFTWIW